MFDIDDIETLAGRAITIVLSYLGGKAKGVADKAIDAAGTKVLDWMTTKFDKTPDQGVVDPLLRNPESKGAQKKLEGALLSRLEEDRTFAEELATLLAEVGAETMITNQTQKISGTRNIGVQTAGRNNTTKIGSD